MTDARAIANELREVAGKLKEAAVWNGSGLAVDAAIDSFVYELLCYFHLALAADAGFKIRIEGTINSGKYGQVAARWPKSPGLKPNFSFFRLTSRTGSEDYQLCPGIEITDRHGKSRAPDMNLLKGEAQSSLNWQDLLACWDAKYSVHNSAPLRDEAVSKFIHTYRQLGNPSPPPAWRAAVPGAAYQRSGILTNAQPSTEPDGALEENGLSETSGFPLSPKTRP